MDSTTAEVPVLIAGAGPAGVTAATTLARYGVPVTLVERRDRPSSQPKATVISTRTMELIRAWGLVDEVLAGGVDAEMLAWSCTTLADPAGAVALNVGYPTRAQAALVSPAAPACVPQDHLESVLLEHLEGYPMVRVLRGVDVTHVDSGRDGARVTLGDLATGAQTVVQARYVIAAEGARSVTRDAVGIRMAEPLGTLSAVRLLFRAPLWKVLEDRRYGVYFTSHPDGSGTFLPAGGDRWIYGVIVDGGGEALEDVTEADMIRLIREGSGLPELDIQVERLARFDSAAQLAEAFRRGNVFIVGDAAHRMTPRGGIGMNMAVHGAFDLAWKLAWVLRGWADERLLDTYEREQRGPASYNVARSAGATGRDHASDLETDLGGRLPHHWIDTATARVSTVDLVGPGLTMLSGPAGHRWMDATQTTGRRVAVHAHTVDAATASAMSLSVDGAILVRPDGRPVARWSSSSRAGQALRAAIDQVTGADRAPGHVRAVTR